MANRGDYRSLPYAGFLNAVVENGETTPAALLQDIKEGLYVKGMRGSGTDATTGSFSAGASGFWIKDGALAFPVDGVTLGGSTLEILKKHRPDGQRPRHARAGQQPLLPRLRHHRGREKGRITPERKETRRGLTSGNHKRNSVLKGSG